MKEYIKKRLLESLITCIELPLNDDIINYVSQFKSDE